MPSIKLGDLIEQVDVRNTGLLFGPDSVKGISTDKKFIDTKADLASVPLYNYKIVSKNDFVYVADTSRRGEKIALAFCDTSPCIVSSIYTSFHVKDVSKLLPRYLMMFFNRAEFDRYARFNSWGSARETFSWEDMCDIDFELPPLDVQRKYVTVYESLLANLHAYESRLCDLKLTCEAYIEDLRRKSTPMPIGPFIAECKNFNSNGVLTNVKGVNASGEFCESRANLNGVDLENYKLCRQNEFAYNPSRINLGSLARNSGPDCIVSPMYIVFRNVSPENLDSKYLNLWLNRSEFFRSTLFYAYGSVRDTFGFDLIKNVKIPFPPLAIQKSIASVFDSYLKRIRIRNRLEAITKNICPVLVRGAIRDSMEEH